MTVYLDDGDVRLYLGDALETVRGLPDDSVDCVVTSPPYWGLRDYGTGSWDGGNPDCDHVQTKRTMHEGRQGNAYGTPPGAGRIGDEYFKEVCGKCGATRTDRQMGLEPTPDLFVAGMVELFREVRRVLAPHGTCWVNLGDSYAQGGKHATPEELERNADRNRERYVPLDGKGTSGGLQGAWTRSDRAANTAVGGLKPKDLVGAPWRVAFALQADGWWLRSDIIWAKPNPMPESVTDRPTKAHEYVFLLTKQPRYWFDTEAVREPADRAGETIKGDYGNRSLDDGVNGGWLKGGTVYAGRNVRSVWNIATQPYPEAHFATFPEELARRCILAGCPVRVCRVCGKPSERIVERTGFPDPEYQGDDLEPLRQSNNDADRRRVLSGAGHAAFKAANPNRFLGWTSCDCPPLEVDGHDVTKWRPGVTLDPFIGSGTVAKVARDHQRHAIGIDLNETYLELAARRLQQLSLLT